MQMGRAVRKRQGQMKMKVEGEKREERGERAGTWTGADGDREIVKMGREEGEEERGDVGTEIGKRWVSGIGGKRISIWETGKIEGE